MAGIALLAALILAAGWYVLTGYVFRYKRCRHCRGLGTEALGPGAATSRSGTKQCRECHGYARVLRWAALDADGRRRGARRRPARRQARQARQARRARRAVRR
jgi:hypothetical protein